MKVLIFVALVAVCASAYMVTPDNVADHFKFVAWREKYSKSYLSQDLEDKAFLNFQETIKRIAVKSAQFPETEYGLTKFADMSPQDFKAMLLTYRPRAKDVSNVNVVADSIKTPAALPDPLDWRSHEPKVVSPVKDQEQCGSCWAFSATESIESQTAMATGKLPILSPQQIVDCDTTSYGCNGGWTESAFLYVQQQGGQDTEASYPYAGVNQNCAFNAKDVAAKLVSSGIPYTYATPPCNDTCSNQDENKLRASLATVGPLSICVDASSWSDYMGGIFSDCSSNYQDQDHCVQLVGYNWSKGYWIVRNSWNTDWGVNGYIYLKTNVNACGLADDANFPSVAK